MVLDTDSGVLKKFEFVGYGKHHLLTGRGESESVITSSKINKIKSVLKSKIIEKWIYGQEVVLLRENEFLEHFDVLPNDKDGMLCKILEGDTRNCNLLDELNLRYEELIDKQVENNVEDQIAVLIEQIENWFYKDIKQKFYCFQTRLEINAQGLSVNFALQLKKFIRVLFAKSQPRPCLKYLEGIVQILKDTVLESYKEVRELENRKRSANRAFKNLAYRQGEPHKNESLLRALLIEYQSKIKIESISLVIHCIQGLIRNLNFYIEDLIQVNYLLANVQNSLKESAIDPILSSFIEQKFYSLQDPIELLREIERELGYSVNNWGRQYHIDPNLIQEKIAEKISHSSQIIFETLNGFDKNN